MNWLDIVIIGGVGWFTFTGLTAGFIREVFNLGGLILGVVLAGKYYGALAGGLTFISSASVAKIFAFILIFVAVLVVVHVLASLLHQVVSFLFLGWIDHLGGALFGLIKGAAIFELFLIAFTRFPLFGMDTAIQGSIIGRFLLDKVPVLLSLLPQEFSDVILKFF